jgi:hypothetical protein
MLTRSSPVSHYCNLPKKVVPYVITIFLLILIGAPVLYFFITTMIDFNQITVNPTNCTSTYVRTIIIPGSVCKRCYPPTPINVCLFFAPSYNISTMDNCKSPFNGNHICYLFFNSKSGEIGMTPTEDSAMFNQYDNKGGYIGSIFIFVAYLCMVIVCVIYLYNKYKKHKKNSEQIEVIV